MTPATPPGGQVPTADPAVRLSRRERNKLDKLERIVEAAGGLFAERGVEDVTTQQVADAADIGTGTLFLYARTKAELLLLVQNTRYEHALAQGIVAAQKTFTALEGALALIDPIVECNRTHVGNGRVYLREMVFGDPEEPHHARAIEIVSSTEAELTDLLTARSAESGRDYQALSQAILAAVFITLAGAPASISMVDLRPELERLIRAILS